MIRKIGVKQIMWKQNSIKFFKDDFESLLLEKFPSSLMNSVVVESKDIIADRTTNIEVELTDSLRDQLAKIFQFRKDFKYLLIVEE